MNIATWVAIFMPIFVLLIIVLPQRQNILVSKVKRKRGRMAMANELIKKYIGKKCVVTTGSFGSSVNGQISDVVDNWIEINTKKGSQLVNADFVTNITEVPSK